MHIVPSQLEAEDQISNTRTLGTYDTVLFSLGQAWCANSAYFQRIRLASVTNTSNHPSITPA